MSKEIAIPNKEALSAANAEMFKTYEMTGAYSSLIPTTAEDRARVFNATANPDARLKDCVNMPIEIEHVFIEAVELEQENDDTGMNPTRVMPRTIFLTTDGKAYSAVSTGVYSAVRRLFSLYGTPDMWDKPVTIKPVLTTSKKGQVLSFTIV